MLIINKINIYTDYIFMIIQKWKIYKILKKYYFIILDIHNYYIRYICVEFIYYVLIKQINKKL